MLKVNNRNIRTRCEICSKLTIKIPGIFIVNFEHVIAGWVISKFQIVDGKNAFQSCKATRVFLHRIYHLSKN